MTDKVYGQYTYQNVTACTILVNCIVQYRHLRIDIPLLVASLTVFHPSNGYQTTIRVRASVSVSFPPWKIFNPGKQDENEKPAAALDALRIILSYRQHDQESPDTFKCACAF